MQLVHVGQHVESSIYDVLVDDGIAVHGVDGLGTAGVGAVGAGVHGADELLSVGGGD